MQQRTLKIIVVFALFLQSLDLAAQNGVITPHYYPFAKPKGIYSDYSLARPGQAKLDKFVPVGNKLLFSDKTGNDSWVKERPFLSLPIAIGMSVDLTNTCRTLSPISSNYYAMNMGFFCQKEWQFEKITSIPLRFRVGLIDYVNYLEGKPNATILH